MRSSLIFPVFAGLFAACPAPSPQGATPLAAPADAIELVETAPIETTLDHPDVADAADVWVAMIDRAQKSVDFAEFYASEPDAADRARASSKLTPVIAAIGRATARGVRVRFLADALFSSKYPDTLAELERAGVVVRKIDVGKRSGGVLHAKYFVVDGAEAYIGSQNFDWRALAHIQEMGVRVSSPAIARALLDVLETDWALADASTPAGARVKTRDVAPIRTSTGETVSLVLSPKGWLADESAWDLPKIVALLDGAKAAIDLQVLTYKTKDRDGGPFFTLDDALRRAAARGVRVRVLVSDWSSKPGSDGRKALDALASNGVDVRVIAIPPWSGGEIPFARVAHAKYLIVDGASAWVGTSNWEGDYFFKSRNAGVVVTGGKLPARLDGVFEDGWTSPYAKPLTSAAEAPPASAAPPSSSGPARP
ncbi:MAG: hypothetical protein KF819_27660 [Labilithrix sp.]|nr:hypothetical protein [Labilithrix sp.]